VHRIVSPCVSLLAVSEAGCFLNILAPSFPGGTFPINWRKNEGGSMEAGLRPLRNRIRRRLTSIIGLFGKLPAILRPHTPEVRLQRMCPFCGLITLRHKTSCLECGRSLKPA
jgi:hypothetical protein